MEVILLKDVPGVGRRYQIIKVSHGYGRNFLLPRQLAAVATVPLQRWAQQQQERLTNQQRQQQNLTANLNNKLQGQRLTVRAAANDQGTLYQSLPLEQISAAVKKQFNIELQEKDIKLDRTIKQVGTFTVKIRTAPGQETPLELLVKPLTK